MRQDFGNNAVNEHTVRQHWFQKFRSVYLSLCDEPRSECPQVLDDKTVKAAERVVTLPNAFSFLIA